MKQYLTFSPDEWSHTAVFAMRFPSSPCASCYDLPACCGCDKGRLYKNEYAQLTDDEKALLADIRNVQAAQDELDKANIWLQKVLENLREKYGRQATEFNSCCRSYFITSKGEIKKSC